MEGQFCDRVDFTPDGQPIISEAMTLLAQPRQFQPLTVVAGSAPGGCIATFARGILPSVFREQENRWYGFLWAAVLGANDGIVSTASLIIGVAAANTTPESVILAGAAGLVAGAMSMAAGEYVSVSSQSDTEKADLAAD
jgi:hypothetical protein